MAVGSPSQSMGEDFFGLQPICEAVGFPPELLTRDVAVRSIIPCIIEAACSDYNTIHPSYTHPVLQSFFGTQSFSEGAFKHRLQRLMPVDGPHQPALDTALRACGSMLARQVITNIVDVPNRSTLAIKRPKHAIEFDGKQAGLAREVKRVIDYGPGLQGKFRILEQYNDLVGRVKPYQYIAFDKGPFADAFLRGCWRQLLEKSSGAYAQIIAKQIYIGSEQGMAAASTQLIESEKKQGNSGAIADLILATNVHEAGEAELETAIGNAYTLLRPGGSLFVRGPKQLAHNTPQALTGTALIDMALDLGFTTHKTRVFGRNFGESGLPTMWLSAVLNK